MTRRRAWVVAAAIASVAGAASSPVRACSACFGEASGPLVEGARLGVYLLFGLTVLVQGAFAAFFVQLYRRSKRARRRALLRASLKVMEGGR